MTSDLEKRLWEHRKNKYPGSFTSRYKVWRLVYLEEYHQITDAITREKQLKCWRRNKKLKLINRFNADWTELAPFGPHM